MVELSLLDHRPPAAFVSRGESGGGANTLRNREAAIPSKILLPAIYAHDF